MSRLVTVLAFSFAIACARTTPPAAPSRAPAGEGGACQADNFFTWHCPTGNCAYECLGGSTCDVSCPGGGCKVACDAGATCNVNCEGGRCASTCAAGSTCKLTCPGGSCANQCAEGATCTGETPPG
jgi:hypothetical protein